MVLVDGAIYEDGQRHQTSDSLQQTYEQLRARSTAGDRFGWIGLYRPDEAEISSVTSEFGLHGLAAEDAVHAHQRPKLELYGETHFLVLRPARYVEATDTVEIGELHVFVGADFLITIRHAEEPDLAPVRERLERDHELLRLGPRAALYAVLDQVVDDYMPVVRGLQNDLDEIESEVFGGESTVSRRIYQLSREIIEFQRASRPLLDVLDSLASGLGSGEQDVELHRNLRDVRDHTAQVAERVESFRQLLTNILTVNSSLIAQRQNEEMTRMTEMSLSQNEDAKRISSWAAILFTPTLVGTIYGMNFKSMPELEWTYGYPMALGLMLAVGVVLYIVFKHRSWL